MGRLQQWCLWLNIKVLLAICLTQGLLHCSRQSQQHQRAPRPEHQDIPIINPGQWKSLIVSDPSTEVLFSLLHIPYSGHPSRGCLHCLMSFWIRGRKEKSGNGFCILYSLFSVLHFVSFVLCFVFCSLDFESEGEKRSLEIGCTEGWQVSMYLHTVTL